MHDFTGYACPDPEVRSERQESLVFPGAPPMPNGTFGDNPLELPFEIAEVAGANAVR